MKRISILFALMTAIMTGCNNPVENAIKTQTVEFAKQTLLSDELPYTFDMEISLEWPTEATNAEALENMQRGITKLLFGSNLQTTDIEYAMAAYNENAVEHYREINEEYVADIDEEWEFLLNWSESLEGNFLPEYKDMVSYTRYIYGYSGGAHGMDARTAATFCLKTGEIVTESNLFIEGYEEKLTEALRRNLLLSIEDKEMLFETEIYPSSDFYLTAKGITYIYQRYEIGPYVLGIIEVTIPWNEIQDILK